MVRMSVQGRDVGSGEAGVPALPTLEEIREAERRIRKYIPPTPLEHSPKLSELCGRDIFLKLETFQPTRVFKIRGALNRLLSLDAQSLSRGVITASSGNHGFAIAFAARLFGARAVICVPVNVNPQKVRAIVEQGAEVIRTGENYDGAYENALKTAEKRGLTFVHAFDDRAVIAGQGTCGLEIARQRPDIDSAVVAIGGGGLISGISIALKGSLQSVSVYGAETEAIPSMYVSVAAGKRTHVDAAATIADGMQASIPGRLTFEAVSANVDRIGLVNDRQIEDAIYDLFVYARVLAEPAGASTLAAIRGSLHDVPGKRTVLVISGGNISPALLSSILARRLKQDP
jgi:threonine dehydratase